MQMKNSLLRHRPSSLLLLPLLLGLAVTARLHAQPAGNPVLLRVAGETYTASQVDDQYHRTTNNSGVSFYSLSRDSALAFLNLFANYRLKVRAAIDAGYNRRPEVARDLESSRLQVAVPPPPAVGFLLERKVVDPAVERIFRRRDDELKIGLIYKSIRGESAADSAAAYASVTGIYTRLQEGVPFEELARDSSDDPATKANGGVLPTWITAGMILPEIENSAYETAPGRVYPGAVRIPGGYVLVKTIDRQPRLKVRAAHILITVPENSTDTINAFARASSALARIRGGEDFAKVAREVSEDRISGANGGDFLSWYTRALGFEVEGREAKLDPIFQTALYKLKKGEVSDLVRTRYGYHIIRVLDSRKPTFEEERETIRTFYKQRLMAGDRDAYIRASVERHGLAVNESVLGQMLAAVNPGGSTADTAWAVGIGPGLRRERLYSFMGQSTTVGAFIDSTQVRPDLRAMALNAQGVRAAVQRMVERDALIEDARNLETEYPAFDTLMREFRDGILIFAIEDSLVWKRVNGGYNDTEGRAYYERNRNRYLTPMRLALTELFVYDEAEAKTSYEQVRVRPAMLDSLAAARTQRQGFRDRRGRWGMSDARNADIVRQVLQRDSAPKPGKLLPPFPYQSGYSIVRVDSVQTPRPMPYEEARPEVQNDYLDELQKRITGEWIAGLRSRYGVTIDERALGTSLRSSGAAPGSGEVRGGSTRRRSR